MTLEKESVLFSLFFLKFAFCSVLELLSFYSSYLIPNKAFPHFTRMLFVRALDHLPSWKAISATDAKCAYVGQEKRQQLSLAQRDRWQPQIPSLPICWLASLVASVEHSETGWRQKFGDVLKDLLVANANEVCFVLKRRGWKLHQQHWLLYRFI